MSSTTSIPEKNTIDNPIFIKLTAEREYILNTIPTIKDILYWQVDKIQTMIKTNNENIAEQKKNISLMEEGISICNSLISEKKNEIVRLEENIKKSKEIINELELLKQRLENINSNMHLASESTDKKSKKEDLTYTYIW